MTKGNVKAVCSWIGNTPEVAIKHYAQVTDEAQREAAKMTLLEDAEKTTQHATARSGNEQKDAIDKDEENVVFPSVTAKYRSVQDLPVGRVGVEPT